MYPSTLSLLLRHLLLSHEAYHLHKTCTSLPQTTKDVRLLSKDLLPLSKDPPPLPCENPGGGSLGEWLLAVEDAQARVHVCLCIVWPIQSSANPDPFYVCTLCFCMSIWSSISCWYACCICAASFSVCAPLAPCKFVRICSGMYSGSPTCVQPDICITLGCRPAMLTQQLSQATQVFLLSCCLSLGLDCVDSPLAQRTTRPSIDRGAHDSLLVLQQHVAANYYRLW